MGRRDGYRLRVATYFVEHGPEWLRGYAAGFGENQVLLPGGDVRRLLDLTENDRPLRSWKLDLWRALDAAAAALDRGDLRYFETLLDEEDDERE